MVFFFFYNKFTNKELIDNICPYNKIIDGSIMVEDYDLENNKIIIGNNNKILQGKIVEFNISLDNIIDKINFIAEYKLIKKNKKYTIDTIQATSIYNNKYNTYIIY